MPKLAALLAAVVLTAVTSTIAVVGAITAGAAAPVPERPGGYTLLQMNLCLSGVAACYAATDYPAVLDDAVDRIVAEHADAVTIDEACSRDAAQIARQAGYRIRFTAVQIGGEPMRCVDPGGRGVYGLAVLTEAPIIGSDDQPFGAQADEEQRRWLCVTGARPVTVCTAHLSTRGSALERRANDRQCAELHAVLARRVEAGPTVFGGDVNRQTPCAPATMTAVRDTDGEQNAGIQHVYAGSALTPLSARAAAAAYTDHDYFVVTGSLRAQAPPGALAQRRP